MAHTSYLIFDGPNTLLFVFILKGGRDDEEEEAGKASQVEGMPGSGARAGSSGEK